MKILSTTATSAAASAGLEPGVTRLGVGAEPGVLRSIVAALVQPPHSSRSHAVQMLGLPLVAALIACAMTEDGLITRWAFIATGTCVVLRYAHWRARQVTSRWTDADGVRSRRHATLLLTSNGERS